MKNKNIIVIICCIIGVSLIIYMKISKNNDYENVLYEDIQTENIEENLEKEDIQETIKVHICGEVINPGLIEIEVGSRIADAIDFVGGTTDFADISKINLAYILSDGEKIYIPNINDEDFENQSSLSGNTKININTATVEQLQTLDGIGQSTAETIISYREENGKFTSIEDIKNVSGIGESKFEKIKEKICVK